jgi:hypothetical protein
MQHAKEGHIVVLIAILSHDEVCELGQEGRGLHVLVKVVVLAPWADVELHKGRDSAEAV